MRMEFGTRPQDVLAALGPEVVLTEPADLAVYAFDAFTEDNDPHGEHAFGSIDEGDVRNERERIDLLALAPVEENRT